MFREYTHVERMGNIKTQGIFNAVVYIFPKLDGTNGSVWYENEQLHFGSRKRELSMDSDNAGFMATFHQDERLLRYLQEHPTHILYGEFLVRNHIKHYTDGAWRKFYVFDVFDTATEQYLCYDDYVVDIKKYNIDFIPCVCLASNPSQELLDEKLKDDYLMQKGCLGEGIVIKNYGFINSGGVYGKIVREGIRSKKQFAVDAQDHETLFVNTYVTNEFIMKEVHKLLSYGHIEERKFIPTVMSTVYSVVIQEELASFALMQKVKSIDFVKINQLTRFKIRNMYDDIIGEYHDKKH